MLKSKFTHFNLKQGVLLSRDQQRMIKGGLGSTATAECSGGISVTCVGDGNCTATDNDGCSCKNSSGPDDEQSCPASFAGVF
ncbi:MAG TPA: hypothetical protein DCS93_01435 [Microscillaceae bacterium]|nr:hypothetical protein [Microscillaceae bacterium]